MILLPPDEQQVEYLEDILKVEIGFNYFYDYLKKSKDGSAKQLNHYHMMNLYTDLCYYDVETRKFRKQTSITANTAKNSMSGRDHIDRSVKSSMLSNISVDEDSDYFKEA
jgi:hypothetical protein